MEEKKYWFPAKPRGMGWGWGLPITWQGWVVFIGFFVLVSVGLYVVRPFGELAFALWTGLLAAALLGICFLKGEPPGANRKG
ncbi:MAG: hypothetical protein ACXWC2_16220 [Ramlibacter sp.]